MNMCFVSSTTCQPELGRSNLSPPVALTVHTPIQNTGTLPLTSRALNTQIMIHIFNSHDARMMTFDTWQTFKAAQDLTSTKMWENNRNTWCPIVKTLVFTGINWKDPWLLERSRYVSQSHPPTPTLNLPWTQIWRIRPWDFSKCTQKQPHPSSLSFQIPEESKWILWLITSALCVPN